MVSPENPNWLLDYPFNDDISVPGGDFPAPVTGFNWPPHPLNVSTSLSMEVDVCFEDSVGNKETGSRKRGRSETCDASGSKACREKMRRDRLNDKFLELGSILNPGRPPKMDKVAILSDAVRALTLLKSEAQKLKNTNESLQNKIKELKVEKNELRDEKQRLKLEKENLEKQIRASNVQPSFLPHPAAAAFTSQARSAGDKLMPFVGYPGVAMWQFMPPAALDTSQDHVLRPPVA